MKELLSSLLLLLLVDTVTAQDQAKLVRGIVKDSLTFQPIGDVHVISSRGATVSDVNGVFQLQLAPGDSIYFSHIAYKPAYTLISKTDILQGQLYTHLAPYVRILGELRINSFYAEEQFKTKVLETTPQLSREMELASENSEAMKNLWRYAPEPVKTPAEVYFESLEGPKGVTFFSTSPSRGIVQAIRNIKNKPVYRAYERPSRKINTMGTAKAYLLPKSLLPVKNIHKDSVVSVQLQQDSVAKSK